MEQMCWMRKNVRYMAGRSWLVYLVTWSPAVTSGEHSLVILSIHNSVYAMWCVECQVSNTTVICGFASFQVNYKAEASCVYSKHRLLCMSSIEGESEVTAIYNGNLLKHGNLGMLSQFIYCTVWILCCWVTLFLHGFLLAFKHPGNVGNCLVSGK